MTEEFFKAHELKQFSPQLFLYFKLMMADKGELSEMVTGAALGQVPKNRQKEIVEEADMIKAFSDPKDVVRYMKRMKESVNREVLCTKVLDMQDETVPEIINKLIKTANDSFVEMAVMVLAKCDIKHIEQLKESYKEIIYPYAQSGACMVLGMRGMEDCSELLMHETSRFSREYPNETYEQGPLIGMHVICKRPLG